MRVTKRLLRQLSELADTDRNVLSIYIDLKNGWDSAVNFVESEAEKVKKILSKDERENLKLNLELFKDFVNEKKEEGIEEPGIAFFVDLGTDFVQGVELTKSPDPRFSVSQQAVILPLALEFDEYEPVGVIMIDASGARIIIAAGDVIEDKNTVREKIPQLSKVGGWSQMRYQRRRTKKVKTFTEEVADMAIRIFDNENIHRYIIAGRDRMISYIIDAIPKVWQEKLIDSISWDLEDSNDEFLDRIRPILMNQEREQETKILERFVSEFKKGGLAVADVDEIISALEIGQVDILLLDKTVDLKVAEKLTGLAQLSSSYVEFIPNKDTVLTELGGVGALLRYKVYKK